MTNIAARVEQRRLSGGWALESLVDTVATVTKQMRTNAKIDCLRQIGKANMRNSIQWTICLVTTILLVSVGCEERRKSIPTPVTFVTSSTPIAFTFPGGWYENTEQHPFNLQCFSPTKSLNTGVFAYTRDEIREGMTPLDVFWESVNDLKSKRRAFSELRALQRLEQADKTITSIAYSGERDSSQYCYRFSLVEFKSDATRFAVSLQVAHPDEWAAGESILAAIVQSATLQPVTENTNAQVPASEASVE